MNEAVARAFKAVPRIHFLPEDVQDQADYDQPVPIGFGMTNSQPYTVGLMLDWLDVHEGDKVLDVGSGSGWTTSLLAHLTGSNGTVVGVDIIPELVEFGRENSRKVNIYNAEYHVATEEYGWPEKAPYDRILVSAAAQEVPAELIEQLKRGGRMVVPIQSSIYVIDKDEAGDVSAKQYYGFAFVPLQSPRS